MSTLVIAEAGVNHNGDLALAHRLVAAAADAGADVVKFQTFSAAHLATSRAPKADYQALAADREESQYDMLVRLALTREMHVSLMAHCAARGIGFFSTAFDEPSLDMLIDLDLAYFKVSSGEITNLLLLRKLGRLGKPLIVSTGMADMEEIGAALHVLQEAGSPRGNITLLHCTTAYPAPMADVNLRAMLALRDTFGVTVGYSDHTVGTEIAIAATALGASVIEKHFTMDRTLPGPDHRASLEPDELRAMVTAIRHVERAMGDGIKRPSPSEIVNKAAARKSLVACRPIRAGEVFDASNVTAKRPGTGLSPMKWDHVTGHRAPRDFAVDEMIEL